MNKKFENEEAFHKFLEEEYIKEAEEIEARLFPNGEVIEAELSEDEVHTSFERLTRKLKQDGEYDFYRDKENIGKRHLIRWRFPFDRTAAAIVLAGLSVLGASLSSSSNREAIVYRFRYLTNVSAEVLENESQGSFRVDGLLRDNPEKK